MFVYLIILVGAYLFFTVDNHMGQSVIDNIKSSHFPLSGGFSVEIVEKMKKDGMSNESIKQFITMEDEFLRMEKETVYTGVSYLIQATELSTMIKERFVNYNFDYHNMHIRQMSMPSKVVNKWLH
jgi:hypothetical protein